MAVDQFDYAKRWTIVSQVLANPAAGADWVATVPAGQEWRVVAVFFNFQTSSAVANRAPRLVVKDSAGNTLYETQQNATQAASNSVQYAFAQGIAANAVAANNGPAQCGIPTHMTLAEGFTIGSATLSIQTGDQYSSIALLLEEANAV